MCPGACDTKQGTMHSCFCLLYLVVGLAITITVRQPGCPTGCSIIDDSILFTGAYLIVFAFFHLMFMFRNQNTDDGTCALLVHIEPWLMGATLIALFVVDTILIVNIEMHLRSGQSSCGIKYDKRSDPLMIATVVFTVPLLLYSITYLFVFFGNGNAERYLAPFKTSASSGVQTLLL